jgi:hypothetical protein
MIGPDCNLQIESSRCAAPASVMIDPTVRDFVRQRAGDRCEYCRLPQHADEARFHIEYIVARQHAPPYADDSENLALACHRCNLYKGNESEQRRSVERRSSTVIPSAPRPMAAALCVAGCLDRWRHAVGAGDRPIVAIKRSPPARIPRTIDRRR